MAKIEKKYKRLELLVDSILNSIFNNVIEKEETTISGEAEIIHNNEIVGYVNYIVYKNVLATGSDWSYDYPPTADEVEFKLDSASVKDVYGNTGKELVNITQLLNKLLVKEEGKTLNY